MSQVASPNYVSDQPNPGNSGPHSAESENAATQSQFISFAIGDDQYGVDIMAVREIKGGRT